MDKYIDLQSLDDAQIRGLLDMASALEKNPVSDVLRGKVLGLLFMNPSLRTLASFQAGMAQLGGSSFVITPGQGTWSLETRTGVVMDGDAAEHAREAVPVLEQYCDALAVRCFAEGKDLETDLSEPILGTFAACSTKPLINMESAMDHPCQALADWKTLDDLAVPEQGGRFVLSWAWHPKALPLAVPAAAAAMAARRGMDVTVLRPDGFGFPEGIAQRVRESAERGGGSYRESDDRGEALEGAHVIYAKSWGAPAAYGDGEAEQRLRSGHREWCVDTDWFETTHTGASFLHCLPVRRNVVVADAVLDGPWSQVVRQAGNRLHIQKAVLESLIGG